MKFLLTWMIVLGVSSCFRQGNMFKEGKKNQPEQAADLATTHEKDRPTETGAGLPGYLVSCATLAEAGAQLNVGCGLIDKEGVRHAQGGDAWKQYESQLPPDAPAEVQVEKRQGGADLLFDAIFIYTGATKEVLSATLQKVTFSFTYSDAEGTQRVKESTLAGPISDGSIPKCQNPPPVGSGAETSDSILGQEDGKTCRYPNPSEK